MEELLLKQISVEQSYNIATAGAKPTIADTTIETVKTTASYRITFTDIEIIDNLYTYLTLCFIIFHFKRS